MIASTTFAGRRGARLALLAILACLIGLVLTWVLAELVPITHFKDAVALYDLTRLNRPAVELPGNLLLDLLYPPFFAAWSVLLVLLALHSRRRALALAIAVILPLAPLSAELLKPLLAHAHDQVGTAKFIGAASWPSGHATAATVLAWCAVLVASPARRRLVALLGAAFALIVGVALLVLAWHMPSDVVGGYLLATLWVAGAVAALCALEARRDRERALEQPARAGLGSVPGAVRAGSP
ncbi:MAG TPA: phosphatase PAP2 family protein [Solirubrobacteraceae bacterium]|nr:phosphatase PAP2 family protein [Solirubrobacteraceae bacterium]